MNQEHTSDAALVMVWDALQSLLAQCDADILFAKCPPQEEAQTILEQTEQMVKVSRERLRRQHMAG